MYLSQEVEKQPQKLRFLKRRRFGFTFFGSLLVGAILFTPVLNAKDIEALYLANVNQQDLLPTTPWQDGMVLRKWRGSRDPSSSWTPVPDPLAFFHLLLNSNQDRPLVVSGDFDSIPIEISTSLTLPMPCIIPVPAGMAPAEVAAYWETLLSDDAAVLKLLNQWEESERWGFWLWLNFKRCENILLAGDVLEAEKLVSQASRTIQALQDSQLTFLQLGYEGRFWLKHKRYQQAQLAFEKALEQGIAAGASAPVLADLHYQLGSAQWYLAAYPASLSSWQVTLEYQQAFLENHPRRARTLNALGMVAVRLDDLGQAESYLLEAQRLRSLWDENGLTLASTHNNLGILYGKRGQITAAETQFRKALAIRRQHIPKSAKVATLLNNLGLLAVIREDWSLASSYFEEALAIGLAKGAPPAHIASSYLNVGQALLARRDFAKASHAFTKGLGLLQNHFPDSLEEANGHFHLGKAYYEKGSLAKSLESLSRAVEIFDNTTARGKALADARLSRAKVLLALQRLDAAEEDGRFALAVYQQMSHTSRAMAETQFLLGDIAKARSEDALATDLWLDGLESLETQFLILGGAFQVGARFLATFSDYYNITLNHLIEQGDLEAAFLLSERYRSQAFLLDRARKSALQESAKAEHIHHRLKTINQTMERIYLALQQAKNGGAKAAEHVLQLKHLREEKANIKQTWLAEMRPGAPLGHRQIAAHLPDETLLVSFIVNQTSIHAFTLDQAGQLSHKQLPISAKDLQEKIQDFRRFLKTPNMNSRFLFEGEAKSLFKTLFLPFAEQLSEHSRLLVIPDGPLHELPFGALMPEKATAKGTYLSDRWSFGLLSSATYLARYPQKTTTPTYELLAIGSPFQATAKSSSTLPDEAKNQGRSLFLQLTRGSDKQGDSNQGSEVQAVTRLFPQQSRKSVHHWLKTLATRNQFGPLPFSGLEITSIAKFFPENKLKILQEKDANKAAVIAHIKQARYLHFACHSHIDHQTPFLSALILAQNKSSQKAERLHAWEIEEQAPLLAELAVLSACETALGPDSAGSGLLSLTQSFHLAGVPSVAASLWRISDLSTAVLMTYFYKNLQTGFPKDVALQKAQQQLRQSQHGLNLDLDHPYWWAGIQIYGIP